MNEAWTKAADDVRARLLAEPAFAPVGPATAEQQLWVDCDLASLAENRLPLSPDPRRFRDDERAELLRRATGDERLLRPEEDDFRDAFWLVDAEERVGTFAVQRLLVGRLLLPISSLYLFPGHRRRGLGRRAVRRAHEAALAAGLRGLSIGTHWTWQPAVRFYLALGCWVASWKHSLVFSTDADLPERRIEVAGDRARLSIRGDDGWTTLIDAERRGDRLGWREHGERDGYPMFEAGSLLAVALAVRGWPLIRGEDAWQAQLDLGFSDIGGPEGLALEIRRFEAWDREHGWRVETPRIPGLAG